MHHSLLAVVAAFALGLLAREQCEFTSTSTGLGTLVGVAGAAGLALGLRCFVSAAGGGAPCLMVALVMAFAAGGLRMDAPIREAGKTVVAGERVFEARVASVERNSAELRLSAVTAVDGGEPLPQRLRMWWDSAVSGEAPHADERWRFRARIAPLEPARNPGGRSSVSWGRRLGIGAMASGRAGGGAIRIGPARSGSLARRVRAQTAEELGNDDAGALLRALALGDGSRLNDRVRERFAVLGIAHLLAVSGLHLGLVGVGTTLVIQQVGRLIPRWGARTDVRGFARVVGLLVAGIYALVTGAGVPVRRAWGLLALAALAAWRGRRGPRFQALWLAGGAMLMVDPSLLFAPGAQLSFMACGGLLLAAARVRGSTTGVRRGIDASVAATAMTAPLAAIHWDIAAPFSLLANAVAVPFTSFVLLPASLLAAIATGLELGCAGLALGFARTAAQVLLDGAEFASRTFPSAEAPGCGPVAVLLAFGVGCIALMASRFRVRVMAIVLQGVVLACAPAGVPLTGPRSSQVVFLDVGRGDATIVRGRTGAILIDAGSALDGRFDHGTQTVLPALRELGIERLDLVVATHADLDHRGGLPAVLGALAVDELWLPRGSSADIEFSSLRRVAAQRGARIRERGRADPVRRFGDIVVEPLWPPSRTEGMPRNERSLALRVRLEGHRFLFAGDIGERELTWVQTAGHAALRSDVMLIPHHGSRRSGSPELLDAVAARVHVVSAPCPSRRGLPHRSTLDRAGQAGPLWWTGRDGAVVVDVSRGLRVRGWRRPARARPTDYSASCRTSRS